MKLYYAPGACSLAPHILAREAGLDIGLEKVDLRAPERRTETGADYRGVNPLGVVPTLQLDDGQVLTENAVVLQRLAEQAPELGPPMAGPERWRFLERLNFIATELHKGFGPLFAPDLPAEVRQAAVERLKTRFTVLQDRLGDGPWLAGERFTLLDAYAYAVLNWTRQFHIDLSPWPKLQAYLQRVEERPAVKQARAEEGL